MNPEFKENETAGINKKMENLPKKSPPVDKDSGIKIDKAYLDKLLADVQKSLYSPQTQKTEDKTDVERKPRIEIRDENEVLTILNSEEPTVLHDLVNKKIDTKILSLVSVQKAAEAAVMRLLSHGLVNNALQIKNMFDISSTEISEEDMMVVGEKSINSIMDIILNENWATPEKLGMLVTLTKNFKVSKQISESHELLERITHLKNIITVYSIKTLLEISSPVFEEMMFRTIPSRLKDKQYDVIKELEAIGVKIPERVKRSDEIEKIKREAVFEILKKSRDIEWTIEMINTLEISKEFLFTAEVQKAVQENIFKNVDSEQLHATLSKIKFFRVSEEFLRSPKMKNKLLPVLIKKVKADASSIKVVHEIVNIINAEDELRAIAHNKLLPRFHDSF